jgi:hypothetical protein
VVYISHGSGATEALLLRVIFNHLVLSSLKV